MSAKQKDVGSSLTLGQIFCACNFGFVSLFFANFLMSPKGPPFNFFDSLQQNGRSIQKIPKGPPFTFFGTMRLTGDFKKILKKNSVIFFSLSRHSATSFKQKKFREGSDFIFLEFCGRMDLEKYQKVPISVFFRNCETFSIFFSLKGPPSLFFDDLRQKG